jgi:integrase
MRKMHRLLGRQFSQAHALNKNLLDQLLAAAGTGLRGKRDRALLLIAYDTLRRRSELTSLRIDDIQWFSDGHAVILLRRSKTDQEGAGKYLHLSARTCIAIKQWMQVAQITSGFLLRGVSMAKRVTPSLGHGQISRIYKHLGHKAGLDAQVVHKISGHSLRVGGAQDMLISGASLPQIMVKGGWSKPDTAMRYVERTVFASHHMR